MEEIATILPMGGDPGLVAFLCAQCGKSDSMLVYPIRHAGGAQHYDDASPPRGRRRAA